MPRLLLLIPTSSYRTDPFVEAAKKLRVDLVVASEEPSTFEAIDPDHFLTLDLDHPQDAVGAAIAFARRRPLDAVVAVDDRTVVVGAAIAETLKLKANSVASAQAARNKAVMRETLARAGVPAPRFRRYTLDDDPARAASEQAYPVVLKPTVLAASQGVIRADDAREFEAAFRRIGRILETADAAKGVGAPAREMLVEEFIPGREVALEGLLDRGRLRVLALFDKPDPLDGPYFEETIYVTPSRLPAATLQAIADTTASAARALGLSEGPVHAELRVNDRGPWMLEIAARSIGGLCSRTLRFGTGMSLEEVILRHALGMPLETLDRERAAAGVMMIPIPRAGVLREVRGKEEAAAVAGIEQVAITIPIGQPVVPLPEGAKYLGFIFARGDAPEAVEAALRQAHGKLGLGIG